MATLEYDPKAYGGPGIPPRWTRSAKDIVGTAYATSSRIWYTASAGVLNEIYYPTIDLPQVRDMQFLLSDGESFFHDARRDMVSKTEYLDDHGLGVRITSRDRANRYQLIYEVIADPHLSCLLVDAHLDGDDPEFLSKLHLYVLLAPHLAVGGWGNNGNVAEIIGHEFLTAHKTASGSRSAPAYRLSRAHAVSSARQTAGRISTPTTNSTTSSPPPRMETSR